jgi:hypothetical protein
MQLSTSLGFFTDTSSLNNPFSTSQEKEKSTECPTIIESSTVPQPSLAHFLLMIEKWRYNAMRAPLVFPRGSQKFKYRIVVLQLNP